MVTNLENIDKFLLESDIDTINLFLNDPNVELDCKDIKELKEPTIKFIHVLADRIRDTKFSCKRDCIFRK